MTFQFSNKSTEVTLSILGKDYTLVQGDIEAVRSVKQLWDILNDTKEDAFDDKLAFITTVAAAVEQFINGIFGDGSYVEIFAGRRQNIMDMIELCEYIAAELDRLGVADVATAKIADVLEVADDQSPSS